MENNENNVKQKTSEIQNKGKGKTIALMIIVLLLVLALGALAGAMLFGKGDTIVNKIQDSTNSKNVTESAENKTENKEDSTEKTDNNDLSDETASDKEDDEETNIDSFKEVIWYTCDAFKMKLPKSWENKYVVEIGELGEGAGDSYNFKTASDKEYLFSIQLRKDKVEGTTPFRFLGTYNDGTNISYVYMVDRQDAPANAEPYTSMMKDFEANKDDIYIKKVISSFNNSESVKKTIYAKDYTTIKYGSMYKYYAYYIDEADTFCVLNFENNITVEKIVDYTKKLEYNEEDNKIHAYPMGNSFMNNFISERDIEEVVYEGKM
jgi:hypothetical protein